MDGIDAVLAGFPDQRCVVHAHRRRNYPAELRELLGGIARDPSRTTLPELAALDVRVAEEFATLAREFLASIGNDRQAVRAIGSHGQTVFHAPDAPARATVQLGDPGLIAIHTGLTVVGDFRRGDVALGGQGAPLVPAFHRYLFSSATEARAVVNIGGIANVTLLRPGSTLVAFDTGPGNTLLDAWCAEHTGSAFDSGGRLAASGKVNEKLLERLLSDDYFTRLPPKSTGVDYFNLAWTSGRTESGGAGGISTADMQATLAELTAATIASAMPDAAAIATIAVCGGGAYNDDLLARLRRRLPGRSVHTTADWGIPPELVEAAAFAWLARERLEGRPTNEPAVTGARARLSMGGVYLPPTRP